jgi:hypothetical protein
MTVAVWRLAGAGKSSGGRRLRALMVDEVSDDEATTGWTNVTKRPKSTAMTIEYRTMGTIELA